MFFRWLGVRRLKDRRYTTAIVWATKTIERWVVKNERDERKQILGSKQYLFRVPVRVASSFSERTANDELTRIVKDILKLESLAGSVRAFLVERSKGSKKMDLVLEYRQQPIISSNELWPDHGESRR